MTKSSVASLETGKRLSSKCSRFFFREKAFTLTRRLVDDRRPDATVRALPSAVTQSCYLHVARLFSLSLGAATDAEAEHSGEVARARVDRVVVERHRRRGAGFNWNRRLARLGQERVGCHADAASFGESLSP